MSHCKVKLGFDTGGFHYQKSQSLVEIHKFECRYLFQLLANLRKYQTTSCIHHRIWLYSLNRVLENRTLILYQSYDTTHMIWIIWYDFVIASKTIPFSWVVFDKLSEGQSHILSLVNRLWTMRKMYLTQMFPNYKLHHWILEDWPHRKFWINIAIYR